MVKTVCFRGFPGSSAGKESACSTGDPSSIPGLGWSPGEGIGYPLQYSWAPLVAQLVKTPPAMWETLVQSLDWKDPLEEGMATHSSILAWRIPWTEAPGGIETTGSQRVGHDWVTKLTVCFILCEFYHSKQHLKKHIYVLRGIWKFFFPHWEKNRRQTVDGLQRIPVLMLLIPLSTSLSSPLLNNVLYLMMSLLMEDSELHSWSEKPSQLFNQHSSTWP